MEFIRICRANFGKRLKERYKLINPMRCRRVKRTGMDVCCLNREALFSSETEDYRIPPEPEENQQVALRFRTARDGADQVLCWEVGNEIPQTMEKVSQDTYFDYYKCKVTVGTEPFRYYFQIKKGEDCCYYNRMAVQEEALLQFAFCITPGFHTPEWAKGAIMYQIYVDRFCNGDPNNDVEDGEYIYIGAPVRRVKDWNKPLEPFDVGCFYGGDLQGVWDKLDYLQRLHIEVIYFNPIFVSPSNHKYDCQDYEHIDPHYGVIVRDGGEVLQPQPEGGGDRREENRNATKYMARVTDPANLEASDAFFARFVEEVHKRGMRVILDGVFNHCGSFNKWMDREGIYEKAKGYEPGAYVSSDSPYRSFFKFYSEEPGSWPYNGSYSGWWGHDTLPKLNYENSQQLEDYILYVARKWISEPYHVDGWRLDVAADLGHSPEYNHYFWKEFRRMVKMVNPEAIILAEHYGSPKDWLQGDEWDTVMNYDAFMEPVTWFLTGMQKHSDDYREDLRGNADSFWGAMQHHGASFTTPSLQVAMNELSNHDHSRFLTRTNRRVGRTNTLGPEAADAGVNKAVLREAVVIQMTWPGAPTIYYGDEAGVCGFTDPDNRRTYPWGNEDKELIAFHKEIIRIHKAHKEFLTGSLKHMASDYNVIGYGRFTREGQSVILVNNNDYEITKELFVWHLGVPKEGTIRRLLLTTAEGFTTEEEEYPVTSGKVTVTLPPTSAIILRYEDDAISNFLAYR